MATKHTHIIQAITKGFGKTGKDVKTLSTSMKRFTAGMLSAAAAYKAFSFALDSVKLAGKLEGIESGFNEMRKQAGFSINTFSKLDKALNGTADKMTIMTQANNAMLLGITDSEDQMAEMFDVAQRLALAVGEDATFGIESLVTGLGRQSKLMLDNLGIMVDTNAAYETHAESLGKSTDELTDNEKKQGFVNAAMTEAKELVKGLGKENLTTKQKLDKFTTSISNFKAEIGEALIESGAIDEITKYSTALIALAKDFLGVAEVEEQTRDQKVEKAKKAIAKEKALLKDLQLMRKYLITSQKGDFKEEETLWESMWGKKASIREKEAAAIRETTEYKEARLAVDIMMRELDMTEVEVRKKIANEIKHSSKWIKLETNELANHNEKLKEEIELEAQRINQNRKKVDEERLAAQIKEKNEKAEKDRLKKLNDLKKTATKTALQAASGQKTLAQAATDAAKLEIKAYIKTSIAQLIKNNAKHLAFVPPPLNAVLLAGFASAAGSALMQQVDKIGSQTGFEGVVDKPTQFTVGEGGAAEYVSVQPMEGVNNAGGGSGITVNISGNVMSDQFVEEELAGRIQEAVRKGVNFGMS